MCTDVSVECITSIFMVENQPSKKLLVNWYQGWLILLSHLLNADFMIGRFTTMKMEVILSSETSDHIRATRRYIAEVGNIHNDRRDDLNSYKTNPSSP
jgi:hypothetical protein